MRILLFLFCWLAEARTANVGEMEDNDDDTRDDADDDGDEDGEDKISVVSLRVEVGDGETGVGAGVVAGDDGVIDTGHVVPGITHHLWRISTTADVDHQGRNH